ncbi:efflux RND transporter periplasmic adaptor subunit [Marinobacter sp.]|uniref:efflux RND transporter periplasmic adaptor subunit n=1 Tax=Marinobacter sp. TaxID=50741 RepID=UPI0038517E35
MKVMENVKLGSISLALVVAIALVIWLATGEMKMAAVEKPEPEQQKQQTLPRVQTETLRVEAYQPEMLIQGQIEPWRRVTIYSQVTGTVVELPVAQGTSVRTGERLLRISEDERTASSLRAQAKLRQIEAELAATDRLRADNLVSRAEKLRLESELASAKADLIQARLAVDHLTPEVPFDGVVNHRAVELGQYVQPGQALMDIVQVDRLKVSGTAPQQTVARLAEGQKVSVELLDGRTLAGTVSFIASAADAQSRSFHVEAELPNPDGLRIAGGSATMRVLLPGQPAIFLSPAYLTLGDDGRLGVRHVGDEDRVRFTPVSLLSVTTEGAWVTGLPDEVRLITLGGGFVAPGQQVQPVNRDS